MRLLVLRSFTDKYIHKNRPMGSVFEADEKRLAEINAAEKARHVKLVEVLPDVSDSPKTGRPKKRVANG